MTVKQTTGIGIAESVAAIRVHLATLEALPEETDARKTGTCLANQIDEISDALDDLDRVARELQGHYPPHPVSIHPMTGRVIDDTMP